MPNNAETVKGAESPGRPENPEFAEIDRIFEAQKNAFQKAPWLPADQRIAHLKRLKAALIERQAEFVQAVYADFDGRAADETLLAEFFPSVEGLRYAAKRVKRWMKPARRRVNPAFMPGRARIQYQPLGVVGIIVPWNYPIYLAAGPLTYALAAGNRVMIKMSEFTPNTSALFQHMIARTFREDHVSVITGEADAAAAFSAKPWDHLLFTGSTAIGRHVMRAAADNLTPVTLELGGKSPAIIGPATPGMDAAERIAFGKLLNAGQTCIAPDYVLCPAQRIEAFVADLKTCSAKMFPAMKTNPQFTSIVNDRQYQRIQGLLEDAREKGAHITEINPAAEDFTGTRKMPFYVLQEVTQEMRVMKEEIFGPLLPVLPYDTLDEAIAYVNAHPRPLALYYFGYDRPRIEHVLANTHSGGAVVNDTLFHVAQDDLPFGGVGDSGMGRYHGREGFVSFSNARGVLYKPRFNSTRLMYPPYGRWIHRFIYKLLIR
ncbi:MAG: coniferyl aldehyde dehydrogenase [Desulfobacterales bacterium]